MTAQWVRDRYNVPAKRGMRVRVHGQPGTIVSFPGPYIGVRLDGEKHRIVAHPTDEVAYDTGAGIDGPVPESCGDCGQLLPDGTSCDRPACRYNAKKAVNG